jgi:hypothetical protein
MQRSAQQQNRSIKHFSTIGVAAAAFISAWLLAGAAAPQAVSTMAAAPSESAARATEQIREAYGKLPLSFEANRGQAEESFNFLARGPGYTLAHPQESALAISLPGGGYTAIVRGKGAASGVAVVEVYNVE